MYKPPGRNSVSAYDAKMHLSELLEKVEAGEEITITKHGAPVAKLVPVKNGGKAGRAPRCRQPDSKALYRLVLAWIEGQRPHCGGPPMSAAFVLDRSIAMAWLFHDEATAKTAALLNRLATETALVPAWWFIEITNVLAMAERKGRITSTQSDAFIADLSKLGIEGDDEAPDRAFTQLLALCRTHRLTSYDAIYLDLAPFRVRANHILPQNNDVAVHRPAAIGM